MKFSRIPLSSEMMNTDEISAYTTTKFVHKDGTQDIGNIILSGNTLVGDGRLSVSQDGYINGYDSSKHQITSIYYTDKIGKNAIAIGGIAVGENSMAIGYQNREPKGWPAGSGQKAIAEGFNSVAIGQTSYASGKSSVSIGGKALADYSITNSGGIAYGYASHAEGQNCQTGTPEGLARDTSSSDGAYSHAEGYFTIADGFCTHAEGLQTYSTGLESHAEGYQTSALANHSHTDGVKAITKPNDDNAYVYNGVSSTYLSSHGAGTFTIGPVGNLSGFYIGNKRMSDLVASFDDFNEDTNVIFKQMILNPEDESAIDNVWKGCIFSDSNNKKRRIPYSTTYTMGPTLNQYMVNTTFSSDIKKILKLSDNFTSTYGTNTQITFGSLTNLEEFRCGNEFVQIGSYAFNGCHSLISVDLVNTKSIQSNAFSNCDSLSSFNSNGMISAVANYVFANCTALKNIAFNRSKVEQTISLGEGIFNSCLNLETVYIQPFATIGKYAFNGCTKLTDVTFANNTVQDIQSQLSNIRLTAKGCVVHCSDGDFTIQ